MLLARILNRVNIDYGIESRAKNTLESLVQSRLKIEIKMAAEYTVLVAGLKNSFNKGLTRDIKWRISQLKAMQRMLEENEDKILEAMRIDIQRPDQESIITETEFVKNEIISQLRNVDKWTKTQPVPKSFLTLMDKPYLHPEPYGVALIIGAWNFQLQLCLSPLAPAIAAGNCAVIKPSEIAPAQAQVIAELIPKYMDNNCFKVVLGGVPETTALLKERWDYIFYTGSATVGKIIASAASKHLTPCTLELGGKSPVFVDNCNNLEMAAKRLLWGKFNNAGQICVCPDYVLCTKETEKKLVPILKKLITSWYGDKPEQSDNFARIVSTRHAERLGKILKDTQGIIEIGGKVDVDNKFVEPTVITNVDFEDAAMQEEIFGPILPIVNINSADEAIQFINKREKPLAMYVFSENEKTIKKLRDNTSSGGFTVNDVIIQVSVEELPFGGVGNSGCGTYHGKHGFDTFTHYKPVLQKKLSWIGEKFADFRYPPYNPNKIPMIKMIVKNRAMPSFGFMKYVLCLLLGAAVGALAVFTAL